MGWARAARSPFRGVLYISRCLAAYNRVAADRHKVSGLALPSRSESCHYPSLDIHTSCVLQAPYASVETRAAELYPFVIGVRHRVRDKYDSLSKIASVEAPLRILHEAKDAIIPLRHAETLFVAANEPKTMVVYSEAHHDDFSREQILTPLLTTARKYEFI